MNQYLVSSQCAPVRPRRVFDGFTLVEILVSMGVLSILLLISAQVIGQVQTTWTNSTARISQFREARTAFDILTRNISQATLNTHIDYNRNYLTDTAQALVTAPDKYERSSDLHFICGRTSDLVTGATNGGPATLPGHAVFFQAPLGVVHDPKYAGLNSLLCARGYFVQFSSDAFFKPDFLPPGQFRYRYRLMEFSPPAERNQIYSAEPGRWFTDAGADKDGETVVERNLTRPVADNILTLIISPQLEKPPGRSTVEVTKIAPQYAYDSLVTGTTTAGSQGTQHLLPPLVRVVLVAIDERSAERLVGIEETGQPPFDDELSAFTNANRLDSDIARLEEVLRNLRINYRVFSAVIPLRASKWSI